MNKILIAGCAVVTALAAAAMPTKKELAQAQRLVDDVTSADLKALKAGKITAKEVANTHMELAEKAENDAQRYLLLQGAFKLYARCGEYDAAAEALATMNREIDSVSPDLIVEIVSKEMRRVAGERAPKVLAIFKSAKRLVKYRAELTKVEKELSAKPNDPLLNLKCGECLAELGHWNRAIKSFAKANGKVEKIAQAEANGQYDALEMGDFWWDYGNPDDGITQYKYHAVKFYQQALKNPQFEGLRKQQAEQRIAEVKEDGFEFRNLSVCNGELVKVSGNQLKVSLPENEVIEFIKVKPGKFPMLLDADGHTRMTTITRPYWIGKYALTLGQWHALMGDILVSGEYDLRKSKEIDRQQAVLEKLGCNVAIARSHLQTSEFAAKLTKLIKDQIPEGYVVRLPTNAEWEYAVRGDSRDVYADLIEFKTAPAKREEITAKLNGGRSVMKADEAKIKEAGMNFSYNYFIGRSVNSRGICDLFREPEATLDRIFAECIFDARDGKSGKVKGNAPCKKWPVPTETIDPFQYTDAPISHACVLKRGVMGNMMYVNDMWPQTTVRIVIGPDLVSEWNAKQKNDGAKTVVAEKTEDQYLEIDLTGGVNTKTYPTKVIRGAINANTDEYKTNKLLLKYVKPGKFMSGDMVRAKDKCKEVTIQTGFLLGVFEVTQRQWELVVGDRPSFFTNATDYATRPVESVTKGEIESDKDSFLNRLNAKLPKDCGVEIALPYADQWEYACRAGTTTDWYNGKSALSDASELFFFEIGRCRNNGGWTVCDWGEFAGCFDGAWQGREPWMQRYPAKMRNADARFGTAKVGSYQPNAWGFYDILGNVSEHCTKAGCRGGNVRAPANACIPTDEHGSSLTHYNVGFRVAGQISASGEFK